MKSGLCYNDQVYVVMIRFPPGVKAGLCRNDQVSKG